MIVLEQRKSRRFDLKLPLQLLHNGSRDLLESGETRNLSSSGVLFSTSAHLDPGDTVEYLITLPSSGGNTQVRLRCKGKVVRRASDDEHSTEAAATLERWEFLRERSPRPV